jgi:hypothetical protein
MHTHALSLPLPPSPLSLFLMSTVMSSMPLVGSGFQRQTFPFLWVPKLSPASATSFSQQQLTKTENQWLSNSLTPLNDSLPLVLLITYQHELHRKHCCPLLLYPIAVVELLHSCLLVEPLPSNSCGIVACFQVVA